MIGLRGRSRRGAEGMTLIELMVVLAIVGAAVALAVPQWQRFVRNQRASSAARMVADAMNIARTQALATGDNHVVYFGTSTTDACGNSLQNPQGGFAPILVLDDGAPGTGNCCIDPGETVHWVYPVSGVSFGVTLAPAASPDDVGAGDYTTGSSFSQPGGAQARWVVFRPDGIPVAFNTGCNLGTTGSGSGGIYVTNTDRDYAVLLSPLGSVKVERFNPGTNTWVD